MNLRIVEDLEGCGTSRWFRLERQHVTTSEWVLVDSGSYLKPLEAKAEKLRNSTERFVVLQEFNPDPPPERVGAEPQPLVDDDIPF